MKRPALISAAARLLLAVMLCGLFLGPSLLKPMLSGAVAQEQIEVPPGMDLWGGDPRELPAWKLEQSPPRLVPRAKRHREFLQAGVPLEYRNRRSPYPAAAMVTRQGSRLYRDNCRDCHGADGLGDGDAALDLTPSPALLARMIDVQGTVDEYLLWTISEGGAQFGTAMPAFKATLTELQIWQVVGYMRAGFPPADPAE